MTLEEKKVLLDLIVCLECKTRARQSNYGISLPPLRQGGRARGGGGKRIAREMHLHRGVQISRLGRSRLSVLRHGRTPRRSRGVQVEGMTYHWWAISEYAGKKERLVGMDPKIMNAPDLFRWMRSLPIGNARIPWSKRGD